MLNTALPGEFPCKCHVSSHGEFYDGICHGLGITKCGRPYAMIEKMNGEILIRKLDDNYSIRLMREKS